MDIMELMTSPLTQAGPGLFMRWVLAEAAGCGMPPKAVAMIDDVAAMLGYYEPLPAGQAGHLAGPLTIWRTDRKQPSLERVREVEELAMKQRALVAFGGAAPGHHVGTAEIVAAIGNMHKEFMPPEYFDLYTWAATDVLVTLHGGRAEAHRKEKGWPTITDADVLQPGGRLHETYVAVATSIRRGAIAGVQGDLDDPRRALRPIGAHFLLSHQKALDRATQDGRDETAAEIRQAIDVIHAMFPGIDREVAEMKSIQELLSASGS